VGDLIIAATGLTLWAALVALLPPAGDRLTPTRDGEDDEDDGPDRGAR
jgi:hypothetical protein